MAYHQQPPPQQSESEKSAQPAPTRYAPPPHLVTQAEQSLTEAKPEELLRAAMLYAAYGGVTEGLSAVTGAKLPPFEQCPPLVRAGWLAAARV